MVRARVRVERGAGDGAAGAGVEGKRCGWRAGASEERKRVVVSLPSPSHTLQNAFDPAPQQATMHRFLSYRQRFAKFQSARLQKAVAGIAGGRAEELMLGSPPDKKGKRKQGEGSEALSPAEKPAAKKGKGKAGGGGRGRGRK